MSSILSDDPRPVHDERRSEARHEQGARSIEPLWLYCKQRAVGGQAIVRDVSLHGLGIAVARRGGWRLIAALREAHATRTGVDVSRIPYDRHREARVMWSREDDEDQIRFGLQLTEPLGTWAG